MSLPALFVADRPIRLGARIGKGGEGEVYTIEGAADHAIKLYTIADVLDRQPKVAAMIEAGLARASDLVAYPSHIVTDGNGRFAGFVMRRVNGHQPIHHLYAPGDRKANFPQADYRFLVRTALNVARAMADVHARDCVIGDINHSGILVSDHAMVALIDADSFQLTEGTREFLCAVGVPEYTPPELQGRSLTGVRRTPHHDAFGLAVIVFQLLFMGRHPFIGSYLAAGEMPQDKAIAEYRFAYSQRRAVGMRPPPGTALLSDVSPAIAQAFEIAFDQGTARPLAADWVMLLEQYEAQLRRCADNPLHYHAQTGAACPWCRMERAVPGLVLFLPPIAPRRGGGKGSTAPAFDLRKVWAEIEAVQLPPATPPPRLPKVKVTPSSDAVAARAKGVRRRGWGVLLVAGAVLGMMLAAIALVAWLALGAVGLFLLLVPSGAGKPFRARAAQADAKWTQALADWEKRCGGPEVAANKQALVEARRQLEALPAEHRTLLANHNAHRREFQLKTWLEGHRIADARIRGIGPGLKVALASWGIDSAFNVSYPAVLRIDGFGTRKARTLELWRRQIEAAFVYDPRPNATDAREKVRIDREMAAKGDQLRAGLSRGAGDLRVATQAVLARWKAVDQPLSKAYSERLRAHADNDLVNPSSGLWTKWFAWGLVIIAVLAAVAAFTSIPVELSGPGAAPVVSAPSRPIALRRFDPPRILIAAPNGGADAVNARAAPGNGTIVERLIEGTQVLAIGRATAPDGSAWIAFSGLTGGTEYIAERMLRSPEEDAAQTCGGKVGLAGILCRDATLRGLDDRHNLTFERLREGLSGERRLALFETERSWLARRGACASAPDTTTCLKIVYRARQGELAAYEPAAAPATDAAEP